MNISFLTELQKVLDLVVTLLMDGVARVATPSVVFADDDTASTNGKSYVRMPNEFLGTPIQDQLSNAIGLLAHEVGHWLQPLDDVNAVEKETGLNHSIVNLLLDIQLEENVVRIMPLFRGNLIGLRHEIGNSYKKDYVKGLKKAERGNDFLSAAVSGLLLGRFCEDASCSYSCSTHAKDKRLKDFLLDAGRFTTAPSSSLPSLLRDIACRYPELCKKSEGDDAGDGMSGLGGFTPPTSAVSSGGVEDLKKFLQSSIVIYAGSADPYEEEGSLGRQTPPAPEVISASRKIQRRWEVPRATGSVMGPGRLNRLGAVRGDPIPFDVPQSSGKTKPKVQVVLVADWSGSMQGTPWHETRKAAQAVTLAVRAAGGDVRGAVFAGHLMHNKDFSPDIFFSSSVGGTSMLDAHGMITSFGWLPLIWQRFPRHRVVLLTDGNGMIPLAIPTSCRNRTSAILLNVTDIRIRLKVEDTVSKFAERFVHVNNLDEIATAWSLVIPRLAQ
jgi:hypothetical protein